MNSDYTPLLLNPRAHNKNGSSCTRVETRVRGIAFVAKSEERLVEANFHVLQAKRNFVRVPGLYY